MGGSTTFNNVNNDLVLRGGKFFLDNQPNVNGVRFNNSGGVTFAGGGEFRWDSVGGSVETIGLLNVSSGQAVVQVVNDANANPTTLTFTNRTFDTWSTVNFAGFNTTSNARLGDPSGDGPPRILLTGHSLSFIGEFATVDYQDFATYNTSTRRQTGDHDGVRVGGRRPACALSAPPPSTTRPAPRT